MGKQLRQARLSCGLTIEQVSAQTRINVKNLNAIEADQVDVIGSRFIYKSFVRQFASAVGLADTAIAGALDSVLAAMPEPLVPGQPGAPIPPKLQSLKPQPVRISRWVSAAALLVVMLAACSTLYAMWENSRAPQAVRSAPAHAPASVTAPKPAPPVASVVVQKPSEFQLELSAVEQTWLSVMTDGREVYTGTLNAHDTKTLEGKENARIRTGNAGGVQVSFNGKNLGPLGSHGQVLTVVFDRNGYQVLEPQARSSFAHDSDSAR